MLTALSIAGLVARFAALREGVGRFLNANAIAAIAAALAVVVLVAGIAWLRIDAASTATEARDATWKERLATGRAAALDAQRLRDQEAAEAAARERARVEAERDAAIERAAELERRLAAVARADGDPVVLPRDIVRSLRK